jgi:hypothetical protein
MSDHAHEIIIPKEEFYKPQSGGKLMLGFGVGAVVGIIGAVIGFFVSKGQFAFSWLYAFSYFFTICAGALFWVILHHATNSGWSTVVRRQMENLSALFPWLALLFLPILFLGKDYLYAWMRIDPHTDHLMHAKSGYLNQPFFWARAVFYLAFFSIASLVFRSLSAKQDTTGDLRLSLKMRTVAFISLPLFGLSITFAAIDWLMTLDHTWYSTMWGVYIFAGSALSGMALLVLVISGLRSAGYLENVINMEHYHTMGKLMFAFVTFWGYIGFSQYMLIWYSNIPEETSYFLRRNTESWHTLSTFLVIGHFFVPFVLLLRRNPKKKPIYLCVLAAWVLFMHWVDIYVIVMPILHTEGFRLSILDLCTLLAIGSILGLVFLRGLGKRSLFAARDPRLVESLHLRN